MSEQLQTVEEIIEGLARPERFASIIAEYPQKQLAERLSVSFATVNRWEGGSSKPQRAAQEAILARAREAGVEKAGAASFLSPSTANSLTLVSISVR